VIVSTVGLVPEIRSFRASGLAKLAVSLHATTDDIRWRPAPRSGRCGCALAAAAVALAASWRLGPRTLRSPLARLLLARSWVVPVNRKYPLAELMGALAELYPELGGDSKRRTDDFVVIEYVMLKGRRAIRPRAKAWAARCGARQGAGRRSSARGASARASPDNAPAASTSCASTKCHADASACRPTGVNDTEEDARRLLELTRGIYCMINLIVFNPHEGTQFQRRWAPAALRLRRDPSAPRLAWQPGSRAAQRVQPPPRPLPGCRSLAEPAPPGRRAPQRGGRRARVQARADGRRQGARPGQLLGPPAAPHGCGSNAGPAAEPAASVWYAPAAPPACARLAPHPHHTRLPR
jgi:hypothetical protein